MVGHCTCDSTVAGSTPGLSLSVNNLGHVVRIHVPLSLRSTMWYRQRAVMPCGWEGNRMSGFSQASVVHPPMGSRCKKRR